MKKIFLLLFLSSLCFSQTSTTIDEILKNPGNYESEEVTVEGTVVQFVEKPSSTNYYILRSDYGVSIQVNTSEGSPETFEKYSVRGIVYIDQQTRSPFVSEKDRRIISSWFSNNWWVVAIIIGGFVVIGILIYVYRSKKEPATQPKSLGNTGPTSIGQIFSEDEKNANSSSSSKFKTVKITKNQPKTLKFIPGKFRFITGEDTGKEIKLAGYPTANGVIMSFGRDQVKGERENSHVQLGDQYITVSGKQCEVIYKDGDVFVKNLSHTNFTQIDGVELEPNQKSKLKAGSVLKLGELEFEYLV